MGNAVAGIVRSRSASGAARTHGDWAGGDDHRPGSRSRSGSANDAACDTADRRANRAAYDGARDCAASSAGDGAVAVGDSHVGRAAIARVENPIIISRIIFAPC
jgi:hypothetical protein